MEKTKWIIYNKRHKKDVEITKANFSVGRHRTADIICSSFDVSRNHVNFLVTSDGLLYVQDNKSLNGTFVNTIRIESEVLHKLNDKDEVALGLDKVDPCSNKDKYIFVVKKVTQPQETASKLSNTSGMKLHPQEEMVASCSTDNNKDQNCIKQEPPDISEVRIKQEVEINKQTNGYTISDAVIVIDCSDDSNDELPCSQFFHGKFSDSLLQSLKVELTDIEGLNYGYTILVDDEELESPDLLTLLGSDINENKDKPVGDGVVELNNEPTNEENPQIEKVSIENDQPVVEANISPVSTKKFYTKPQLIAPHHNNLKTLKRKKEAPKTDKKRKNIKLEKSGGTSVQTVTKTIPQQEFEKVSEIRKSKLKALAVKKSDEVVQVPKTSKVATAKVKVSNSRGNYLTEEVPRVPTYSLRNRVPKVPIVSKFQSSSVSASVSVAKGPHCSSSVPNHYVDGTFPRIYRGLEDIIFQLVLWNPNWFVERNNNPELPPITKSPLQNISTFFSSYTEYYAVMKPLLMIEMWNFLYKESNSIVRLNKNKLFKCQLLTSTSKPSHSELHCFYFISRDHYQQNLYTKDEDVIFLGLTGEHDGVRYLGYYLGCVAEMKVHIIPNNASSTETASNVYAQVNITIITKLLKETAPKQTFDISVLTTLVSKLRFFRSVKFLEKSSLCDSILKPNISHYRLFTSGLPICFSQDGLNYNQRQAVSSATKLCLGSIPGIYLIHGPPGTGKSTVIINIIREVLFTEHRENKHCILVTAPSNGAVDEIVVRLTKLREELDESLKRKLKLVRMGPEGSIHPSVKLYSLQELTKRNIIMKVESQLSGQDLVIFKDLQAKVAHLMNCPKLKSQLTFAKEQLLQKCKSALGKSYATESKKTEEEIMKGATIICTTLSSCIGARMEGIYGRYKRISCCIVDEATQANEVETLIPLKLGIDKLVLVGDPKQLPPIVFSKEAKNCGFGNSLFSRISSNFNDKVPNPIRLLTMQYRMHSEICKFPNETFYQGQLKNSSSVLGRQNPVSNSLNPYLVLEVESNILCSQEYSNRTEIDCVINLINAITQVLPNSQILSVGVITPYNDQKKGIEEKLQERKGKWNFFHITVNTVDSFQGQEKDIIIMSCVRLWTNNFLSDDQRLNVALTRAKSALYIIGSKSLFESCHIFKKLRSDAKQRNLLKCINNSENLVELIKLKPSN